MCVKKTALIITDGTKTIRRAALPIKEALRGYKVKICPAQKFAGNDLLPVDIFFIGCQKPNPKTFEYLEDFLSHINLASRKCAVFSVNEKTLPYLHNLLAASEANVKESLLLAKDDISKTAIEKWINDIL